MQGAAPPFCGRGAPLPASGAACQRGTLLRRRRLLLTAQHGAFNANGAVPVLQSCMVDHQWNRDEDKGQALVAGEVAGGIRSCIRSWTGACAWRWDELAGQPVQCKKRATAGWAPSDPSTVCAAARNFVAVGLACA